MTKEQAYHSFVSSFAWKAYDENTVPDDAVLPRITYNLSVSEFGEPVMLSLSLWDRSTSWASVTNKSDDIFSAVGRGGVMIPFDGGAIWVNRRSPFAQRMADEDDTIRRILINLNAEFLTA